MERKWIYSIVFCFITFCLISIPLSSGSKRYNFPGVPRLDDEIRDLWYAISYPGNVSARTMQMTHQPCARAYRNGTQLNIPDSTWTKVELNATSFDVGSNFNTSTNKFVASIAGYYQVNANVRWINVIADKRYYIAIFKNGNEISQTISHSSYTGDLSTKISDIIYLNIDDYIELKVHQITGVDTPDVSGGTTQTYMSIRLVQ